MSQLTISQKFFDDLLSFPGRRGLVFGRLLPDLLVRPQVDRRRDAGFVPGLRRPCAGVAPAFCPPSAGLLARPVSSV